MAILKEFGKFGFGKQLIYHCEKYIFQQKGQLIWFNAREIAIPFYEKLGYTKVNDPFIINDIGLHYLMKKEIGKNAYE